MKLMIFQPLLSYHRMNRVLHAGGFRQGVISVFIRGYVYSEEDVGEAETFGMQIDDALETFPKLIVVLKWRRLELQSLEPTRAIPSLWNG